MFIRQFYAWEARISKGTNTDHVFLSTMVFYWFLFSLVIVAYFTWWYQTKADFNGPERRTLIRTTTMGRTGVEWRRNDHRHWQLMFHWGHSKKKKYCNKCCWLICTSKTKVSLITFTLSLSFVVNNVIWRTCNCNCNCGALNLLQLQKKTKET